MDDDKQTDKLFQEGADRHDFAYDPDAWAQMETMLDQDLIRRRWIRIGALLAVILVGGLALFYLRSDQAEFTPAQTEQLPTTNQVSGQKTKGDFDYQSSKADERAEEDGKAKGQSNGADNSDNNTNQLPEPTKAEVITTPAIALTPSPKNAATLNTAATPPASGNAMNYAGTADNSTAPSADPQVATNTSSTQNEPSLKPKPQEQTAAMNRLYAVSQPLRSRDFFLETPSVSIEVDRLAKPRVGQNEANKPKRESTGGLVVAAGFGRVHGGGGDQNFSQGENRFGLEAEYRFGKKFGAKIGGYYGNVSYCAEGEDYTAKEGFWAGDVVAQRVEASCQVVEVPLLLSYYFNGNDRDGFFLNGGVTSYFLLKEDFKFEYEDPTHNGVRSWQEINTNRHLLGFGQFSVGYQQQVGKRTAMQVEAYTQLPLTGIGQGQVNLTNIGVTAKLLFDFRK